MMQMYAARLLIRKDKVIFPKVWQYILGLGA